MRTCGWAKGCGCPVVVWEQRAWVLPGGCGWRRGREALRPILIGRYWGLTAARGSYRSTPYSAYNPETYSGHWKQLTVRTSRRGQAMAIAYFHPQVSGRVHAVGGCPGWSGLHAKHSYRAFSTACSRN